MALVSYKNVFAILIRFSLQLNQFWRAIYYVHNVSSLVGGNLAFLNCTKLLHLGKFFFHSDLVVYFRERVIQTLCHSVLF